MTQFRKPTYFQMLGHKQTLRSLSSFYQAQINGSYSDFEFVGREEKFL